MGWINSFLYPFFVLLVCHDYFFFMLPPQLALGNTLACAFGRFVTGVAFFETEACPLGLFTEAEGFFTTAAGELRFLTPPLVLFVAILFFIF
jgi:hypothetical protein